MTFLMVSSFAFVSYAILRERLEICISKISISNVSIKAINMLLFCRDQSPLNQSPILIIVNSTKDGFIALPEISLAKS